jgi:hypothetical protein
MSVLFVRMGGGLEGFVPFFAAADRTNQPHTPYFYYGNLLGEKKPTQTWDLRRLLQRIRTL